MDFKKIMSIILLIAWMTIVFGFSNQQGKDSGNTSKIVATRIIEIIDIQNSLSHEDKEIMVQKIEPVIRKVAHYSIYTLGGILIINCIYTFISTEKRAIVYSAIIGVIYAVSDEIHQLFIANRSGKIADVVIDSLGILTGIAIYLLIKKISELLIKKTNKGGE